MTVILVTACQESIEQKVSKEDIVSTLKQNAVNLQEAILAQNTR